MPETITDRDWWLVKQTYLRSIRAFAETLAQTGEEDPQLLMVKLTSVAMEPSLRAATQELLDRNEKVRHANPR